MKDSSWKACVAMVCIVGSYGLYLGLAPDPADGAVFAGVMGLVGGLAGFSVATAVKNEKAA